jgi:radical SAM superfamily enzyme YgiQ (UPF0313 family)
MCGKTYRERDVESVLSELAETRRKLIFFVDDNLVNLKKGAEVRAIELFRGMVGRKMNKSWYSQAAVNFADNEQVLHWARKSGCFMLLMGIEAENPNALKDVRKNLNLKRGVSSYDRVFKKMHRHGIGVLAAMIFGMDSDTKKDLYDRRDFILRSSIDTYQCTILTPLPGTVLFDRLKSDDRIVLKDYPSDWQQYDGMVAAINTPNLDRDELDSVMREIWMKLYHKESLRRKMFRTLWNTKSFSTAYWTYATGHNYGRMSLERFIYNNEEVNAKLEWRWKKRSLYLKWTDLIIWLIYRIAWQRMIRKLAVSPRGWSPLSSPDELVNISFPCSLNDKEIHAS